MAVVKTLSEEEDPPVPPDTPLLPDESPEGLLTRFPSEAFCELGDALSAPFTDTAVELVTEMLSPADPSDGELS